MSDNWLVKFASSQPTTVQQFKQQVEAMSFDELQHLVGPSPTSNIESFMDKAAAAITQGRQLAHERGNELLEKSAQEVAIDQSIIDAVEGLSDETAIKLAEMLENGTDVEKIAGVMGMAGGALKSLGGMAFKHPTMAAAAGGAALGAAAGGPGNRIGGALAGGVAGGAASKLIPGMAGKIQQGGFGAALKGQQMINKVAYDEINNLYKTAMCLKSNINGDDGDVSWLSQFEGSPLLEQAIQLAEHEIQTEISSIQKRQERHAAIKSESFDDEWTQRDIIRAQKHLLELQLIAQRNGLGAQTPQGPAPDPAQQGQAAPPPAAPPQQSQQGQGVGGPGGTQMPMGQEKQAMTGMAIDRLIMSGAQKASPERLKRFAGNLHFGRINAEHMNKGRNLRQYQGAQSSLSDALIRRIESSEVHKAGDSISNGIPKLAMDLRFMHKHDKTAGIGTGIADVLHGASSGAVNTLNKPVMNIAQALVGSKDRIHSAGAAIGSAGALGGVYAVGKHRGAETAKQASAASVLSTLTRPSVLAPALGGIIGAHSGAQNKEHPVRSSIMGGIAGVGIGAGIDHLADKALMRGFAGARSIGTNNMAGRMNPREAKKIMSMKHASARNPLASRR